MKKRRLKKWVKIVLIIMIILLDVIIYRKTGILGELAQTSIFYLVLTIMSWGWLLMGQIIAICLIVEN